MATYKTPGVFINETPPLPTAITQLPTSVTAFIGFTQKINNTTGNTLVLKPQHITSAAAYVSLFGSHTINGYLCAAVKLFFENGGQQCYIISVGDGNTTPALQQFTAAVNIAATLPVQLLSIPDAALLPTVAFYQLQQQMLQQCATLQNRFAVLHTLPPSNNDAQDIKNYRAGIGNNNLKWGAVYYPWLITADNKTVPPCGAAAGVFAATDNSNGVWKAPVNISINNITNVTQPINNTLQEYMNIDAAEGKSVNAIRHFTGKGFLIWGGRTLAGNDNEWRYISVRRFTLMVLQSINEGIKAFAFEPNNSTSWIRVRGLIENFLTQLWRNGALAGVRPDHAFFVSVGTGITMSEADVQQGRMIIQVGLAVIRPAEFIISRVIIQLKS